jgi:two-component system sensor histidine kinase DegS
VRRLSRDLRPSVLEHLGFFEAIEWLFEDFSKKYQIEIIQKIKAPEFSFYKEQEITIFRIIQETLANIGKHAVATQVWIELTPEGPSAVFTIRDNGKGFYPKAVKGKNPLENGLGLIAMAERAQMAGGTFHLESAVGKGTRITFSVPIKRKKSKST